MTAINAEVKRYKGKPCIHINGDPVNPYMYALTDTPGARWSWEELPQRQLRNFTDCGVNLFQVQIWLEDIWKKDEPLNIELVQRQLQGVLDVNKDAAIMLRFHINAPLWWNKENPDECTQYCDGPAEDVLEDIGVRRYIIGDLDRRKLHSLSSEKWRQETKEKIEEFCIRLAATKEAERLFSIQFCDGVSHEWHYWGFMAHEPDCSTPMTRYFRNWLRKKYANDVELRDAWGVNDEKLTFDTVEVPGMEYRNPQTKSLFRDLTTERRVIDYYTAQQDSISDDIIFFAEVFKKNWPRKIVIGTFYGYFFTMFFRQAVGGHLNVDKVLDCPYIDFLSAPAAYSDTARELGGTATARGIQEACAIRNKMWFTEMDQETNIKEISTIKNNSIWDCETVKNYIEKTVPRDISIIRRNVMNIIAKKSGFWYFDFGPMFNAGWWDFPDYLQTIKELKNMSDEAFEMDTERSVEAEVLVVFDTKSYYYTIPGWTPIAQSSTDLLNDALYKTGTLIDYCYLFDLEKMNLDAYKCIVFANCWNIDSKDRQVINNRVKKNGRHIIWNYMAGYFNDEVGTQSVENLEEITGIPVELIEGGYHPSVELTPKFDDMIKGSIEFNCDEIYPLPVVRMDCLDRADCINQTKTIGVYEGQTILSKTESPEYTSWYCGIMNINSDFYRQVFKESGVHIYTNSEDTFFGGNGFLVLHSNAPGEKKILTKSGKEYTFNVKDAETIIKVTYTNEGEIL